MREQPKITEAMLQAVLQTHYGVSAAELTFLPIGNDSASFVYRVDASDGRCYFLKIRTTVGFSQSSMIIPRFVHQQGVPHVGTPLPTITGSLWIPVTDFIVTLYPFIVSRPATATGLSDDQWYTLGQTVRQIHTTLLPPDVQQIVQQETFKPSRREILTHLESVFKQPNLSDAFQRELSAFWQERQNDIQMVISRADKLGSQLLQQRIPAVLCHADLHTWNVLVDNGQHLWIVDWDETILAPKERDLMFVIGGIGRGLVSSHDTNCFLRGYGDTVIDPRALVYYRYAWAVQDMGAYAEQVCFSPDVGQQARADALSGFIDLFAPGNIVDIAIAPDSRTN